MRAITLCFPRKRSSRPATSPVVLLARLREVVFKLIMLSTMSKGGGGFGRSGVSEAPAAPAATRTNQQRHQDSLRSEAVEDCIEFFRKSASLSGCRAGSPALPPAKGAEDECEEGEVMKAAAD
ncbi:hypothetical protein AXF42_Ash012517 [Apostasia shenzhenica]|uniref:Josephin-like protein n=1 Tax=Apostasia shenzhenica TaxID=1088818 RepID=A0A2I0AR15_9ASPA|nr:hypothetical protein AXF42_Ash012517 [Apostasia shenzhenica]